MEHKYSLLDCGGFEKLELINGMVFRRPSPQAVWKKNPQVKQWEAPQAQFLRGSDGNGQWLFNNQQSPPPMEVDHYGVRLKLNCTSFGHVGAFFEQGPNWQKYRSIIHNSSPSPPRVLNLFAYTGGASVACAQSGAQVVHLDASKTSVNWAKENAELNQVDGIRFIADDVKSFVEREIRRGSQYEGIILDPPSFGRGTKKQVWKIEEDMTELLDKLLQLRSDQFQFVSLSSHSQGYTPLALENLLRVFGEGSITSREMIISYPEEAPSSKTEGPAKGARALPSGTTALWQAP